MKKLIYCALALAAGLFATSCQQENLEPVAQENTVTFTVETPAALQTKAIADGMNVNQLIYEVWLTPTLGDLSKGAQKLYQEDKEMTVQNGENKTIISLDLVNDQKYTVLLWAQKNGTGVYNTTELNDVHYNSTTAGTYAANDENLAAFYGVAYVYDGKTVKIDGTEAPARVELRRPFAQVNLGTRNTSTETGTTTGYTISIEESNMILKNVPNRFNVVNGATSVDDEFTKIEFSLNTAPCNPLSEQKENKELPGFENPKYWYAGMNYVFASNAETGITAELEYNIVTKLNDGNVVTVNNVIPNVPLKENYRTNIIGNLLTSSTDYEVVIDARFNTPDEVVEVVSVSTVEELVGAIESATTAEGESTNIKLEGDINLNDLFASLTAKSGNGPQSISIPVGTEFCLDLNGYSITGVDEANGSFGLITNRGNLTITNSSSNQSRIALVSNVNRGWNAYSSVLSNNPGGNLLVKGNVVIEHLGGTDMAYGIDNLTNSGIGDVNVTIDGATVKSTYRAIRQFLNCDAKENNLIIKAGSKIESTGGNKSVWMQDSSKKANRGSLVVEEGAELYGNVYISATAGSTEWPVSASVAASTLKNGSEVEISPKELVGYNVVLNDGVYVFEQSWSVDGDEYTIYTAAGLKWVAEEVNKVEQYAKNIFDGKTVLLANDIDLNGAEWIPIGDFGNTSNQFTGTFDGQNHTISNFVVDFNENKVDSKNRSSFGFFGNVNGTVKNLTVSGVTNDIKTPKFVGALIGRLNGGLVENCHVKNSTIEINNWTVGALVGQINNGKISGCSVEGTTVKGYGAVAGIVGIALTSGERTIENCSVKNTTIVQNGSFGGNYDNMFGAIVGALYSGTLTVNLNACSVENTTIKDVASTELCGFISEGDKLVVNGYEILAPGLGYDKEYKTYAVSSAEGLVAMSNTTIKAGESVVLTADIDLAGVEFNGLSAFNSENPNTFDGQDHVVSNWTNEKGASDMGFIKSWVGTIKNLTIKNASLKTNGRSAIIAANTYCNIENCHVVNCTLEDSYWACGLIAGLYNSGSVSNCSATNSSVKSNGGTAAIVGVVNETAGTRSFTNCVVTGCTVNNTGVYGEGYSAAMVCGLINISNSTVKFAGCELSNNTKLGEYVGDLYYSSEGNNVVVE